MLCVMRELMGLGADRVIPPGLYIVDQGQGYKSPDRFTDRILNDMAGTELSLYSKPAGCSRLAAGLLGPRLDFLNHGRTPHGGPARTPYGPAFVPPCGTLYTTYSSVSTVYSSFWTCG